MSFGKVPLGHPGKGDWQGTDLLDSRQDSKAEAQVLLPIVYSTGSTERGIAQFCRVCFAVSCESGGDSPVADDVDTPVLVTPELCTAFFFVPYAAEKEKEWGIKTKF